jgi:hypothetical protein
MSGVSVVCLCLVFAGCSGTPLTEGSSGTPTLTDAERHLGLTVTLDIEISTTDVVHITVTELGDRGRGVVFNRTYSEVTSVTFDEENVFREDGSYQVTIRVNESVRWDERMRHFESYEMEVLHNGSVEIKSHSIA